MKKRFISDSAEPPIFVGSTAAKNSEIILSHFRVYPNPPDIYKSLNDRKPFFPQCSFQLPSKPSHNLRLLLRRRISDSGHLSLPLPSLSSPHPHNQKPKTKSLFLVSFTPKIQKYCSSLVSYCQFPFVLCPCSSICLSSCLILNN